MGRELPSLVSEPDGRRPELLDSDAAERRPAPSDSEAVDLVPASPASDAFERSTHQTFTMKLSASQGCMMSTEWVWLTDPQKERYRLYRTPIAGADRVHVATFDAPEPAGFNQENCEGAARLVGSQPGVTVRYWCEPVSWWQ